MTRNTAEDHRPLASYANAFFRVVALVLFLATISTFTATDSGRHERLATFASLAVAHSQADGETVAADHQRAVSCPAAMGAQRRLHAEPCLSSRPIRSAGRTLSWEDGGVGHMLLTDE